MKKLDRYIAKNFLIGYAIAFGVLLGLRIMIDLFVNLDEFTEHTDLSTWEVTKNIITFYALNSTLFFRDFAGMITVVAAAFSFGKMIRTNELVAVMASGVSLKRTIMPVVVLALILTGVLVVDQEIIIPSIASDLVRSRDDVPGKEVYGVRFISDEKDSLICSPRYDVEKMTLHNPAILLRRPDPNTGVGIGQVTAWIYADSAVYNSDPKGWNLYSIDSETGQLSPGGTLIETDVTKDIQEVFFYASDVTAEDIPVRCKSQHKTLLSLGQLINLTRQSSKIRDLAQLYSQMHFRVTEPVINLVMLLISLPILVCRDPKAMKSAVLISFSITSICFVITLVCKMLSTEQVIFDRVIPEFWAWLPVLIFLPISFIVLDSMKT